MARDEDASRIAVESAAWSMTHATAARTSPTI